MVTTICPSPEVRRGRWRFWRPAAEAAQGVVPRDRAQGEPVRTALLSGEQLERHARRLADRQRTTAGASRRHVLSRLDENARVLHWAHRLVSRAAAEGHAPAEAGVWLLDNYYVIRDQIRTARRELSRKDAAALPRLSDGPWQGFPRVYELAVELLDHLDGQLDQDHLHAFVRAYQDVFVLNLAELWAVPGMLRLAGIENLRRLALQLVWRQQDINQGTQWADRMGAMASAAPDEMEMLWRELIATERPLTSGLVAGFTRRLATRSAGPGTSAALEWLERYLAQRGETIDEAVSQDARNQAADEIAMRNVILSLRGLGGLDWNRFVEEHSAVEQALRSDPAGVYGRMDFATRDYYRHVVERLARGSPLPEEEVARRAVEHARRAEDSVLMAERPPSRRAEVVRRHVGYFLVDGGLPLLEKSVSYQRTLARDAGARGRPCTAGLLLGRHGVAVVAHHRRSDGGCLAAGDCRQRRPRSVDAVADLVCRSGQPVGREFGQLVLYLAGAAARGRAA